MTTEKTTATAAQTDQAATGRPTVPVPLQTPIVRNGQTINTLHLMRPRTGDLRGVLLLELAHMKVDAVAMVLPRIACPTIIKAEVEALDPADLMACAVEVAAFLAPKALLESLNA
ncbi:phage tail assembly protein [Paracidovorax konjaci]|uniref:Phage tail assembly chaperone protein, E, or 41 or 14 n=1 Tax=Paracidovorax konjaci TaxID=32040 RepID=A0A1I1XRM7_9BURK|nr:phage tail assembly protein [Paracidovorax konjaci]SFE09901.1 Phage tail assembly chaperone protein, E, or 41 or 14 [Paracidovorax konjaci]